MTAAFPTAQMSFTCLPWCDITSSYIPQKEEFTVMLRNTGLACQQWRRKMQGIGAQAWDMRQDTALPPGDPTAKEPINAQLKNADL